MRHTSIATLLILTPIGVGAKRQRISTDATCGSEKGYTCLGSVWGNCCSRYGWCGSTSDYCSSSKGCNSDFGTCYDDANARSSSKIVISGSTRAYSTAPTVSSQPVSLDARCGPKHGGRTCQGSRWGCSQYSYCGSTFDYCDALTCQKGFGYCNILAFSSRVSSTLATSRVPSSKMSSSSARVSSSFSGLKASSSAQLSSSSIQTSSLGSPSTRTPSKVSSSSSMVTISSSSSSYVTSSGTFSPISDISSSSSAVASSSTVFSLVPSTSTSSTIPARPSCSTIPDCPPFTSPLTQCTSDTNGKCQSGYQQRCSTQPQPGSAQILQEAVSSTAGDQCASSCTADLTCIAFVFTPDFFGQWYCTLYSSVSSISTGFGSTWVKVCPDSPSASSSAIGSSSSSTSVHQFSSATTSVISVSETSIIASSSISVSSSSDIQSSSSALLASPSSSPVPSPVSSVASSPFPSPSTCPYFNYPAISSCYKIQGSYNTACTEASTGCKDDFLVTCGAGFSGTSFPSTTAVASQDQCVQLCRNNVNCAGAMFTVVDTGNACQQYSAIQSTIVTGSPSMVAFRRICPQAN